MTTTHLIMLLAILVSASVALIVAAQQRKQMRQIELYKNDPSVGLVPPSTLFTRFVKSRWDDALGFGFPILGIVLEFAYGGEMTRLSVLLISLNVTFFLTNVVMTIVFRVVDRLANTMSTFSSVVREHFEITKSHTDFIERHSRIIERLVGYSEKPGKGT